MSNKIRVLIIDDSALVRSILTQIINEDERFEVVGTAIDAFDAREKIKQLNPNVITLDIEMPKMSGLKFLKNLMRLRPMPVVMISSLTEKGAPVTLEALELGAFDYIQKPKNGSEGLRQYSDEVIEKLLGAAQARVKPLENFRKTASPPSKPITAAGNPRSNFLIAIGASTGGTEAIKDLLSLLPECCPPIVVTQHIPAGFSGSYAKRLDSILPHKVHEATNGQDIYPNNVYIAYGGAHMCVRKKFKGFVCELTEEEPINRHRPSVEVLYDSVVNAAGKNAVGILLTGMGVDGAAALLRMKEAGCRTAVQDEETSVVWGMPGAAYNLGAAEELLPLNKIANFIIKHSFTSKIGKTA